MYLTSSWSPFTSHFYDCVESFELQELAQVSQQLSIYRIHCSCKEI